MSFSQPLTTEAQIIGTDEPERGRNDAKQPFMDAELLWSRHTTKLNELAVSVPFVDDGAHVRADGLLKLAIESPLRDAKSLRYVETMFELALSCRCPHQTHAEKLFALFLYYLAHCGSGVLDEEVRHVQQLVALAITVP